MRAHTFSSVEKKCSQLTTKLHRTQHLRVATLVRQRDTASNDKSCRAAGAFITPRLGSARVHNMRDATAHTQVSVWGVLLRRVSLHATASSQLAAHWCCWWWWWWCDGCAAIAVVEVEVVANTRTSTAMRIDINKPSAMSAFNTRAHMPLTTSSGRQHCASQIIHEIVERSMSYARCGWLSSARFTGFCSSSENGGIPRAE